MSYPDFQESPAVSDYATRRPTPTQGEPDVRNDVSAVFSMRVARFKPAMFKLACGALAGGLGAFLISEIPNTPDLTLNLAVIGGIGITAALVLAVLAFRELSGRLVVDGQGIRLLPSWAGTYVSWIDVTGWQMTEEDDFPAELQQLKLWCGDRSFPKIFDIGWMTVDSRGTLRTVLRKVAGPDR